MADNRNLPAKQPHLAWRIARVALHILGKITLWLLVIAATLAVIAAVSGSIFMTKFSEYLKTDVIPKAEDYAEAMNLDSISLAQTSIIYYTDPATGEYKELQKLYATQNRIWVSYDQIPQDMVNAAVAIEDKRFPEHNGVDWLRTLSAVRNFLGGDSSFGASTITQQLIKNLSKDDETTVNRKVQEIFRALAVEQRYTKNEIMEWYLNTIYLGEGCYGVQSAAQVYFGKDISELTPAECASIIAITNNPSLYDPYIRPKNNRERQLTILSEMYRQGYFASEADYKAAKSQEMVFHNGNYDEKTYRCSACTFSGTSEEYKLGQDGQYYCPWCGTLNYAVSDSNVYSYFVDTVYRDVIDDLCEKYEISEQAAEQKLLTGGYRIYATINPDVQRIVDEVYENPDNVPDTISIQQLQSAITVVDNATGDVVAICGGVGKKEYPLSYNRAEAKLPTGSSIKPISVYAPALDAGVVTPATAFEDSPFDGNWPQNDSRSYSGMCLVQRGVTSSLNTISVKTLNALGLQASYDFLTQKLGITTLVDSVTIGGRDYTDIAYAPLALGELTFGLTVREMTQAYATFPNMGTFREARTYTRVEDPDGKLVLDNSQESHTAISEHAAFYVNSMLTDAVSYGTGTPAYKDNVAVAGKTGTSGNNQTRWFAGYTPYYTAVVWCGYDEPEQVILSGSYTNPAITMWRQVMDPLHASLEYRSFTEAEGYGWYSVCSDCGGYATEACEKDIRDNGRGRVTSLRLFYEDAPSFSCTCHTLVKICGESGKIANEYCEHVEGNEIKEVGKLIYNKDWKVNKDAPYVYKEDDPDAVCSIHGPDSTENTEPTEKPTEPKPTDPKPTEPKPTEPKPTEPTTPPTEPPTTPPTEAPAPAPTEPSAAAPPDVTQWFERREIDL